MSSVCELGPVGPTRRSVFGRVSGPSITGLVRAEGRGASQFSSEPGVAGSAAPTTTADRGPRIP